MTDPSLTFDTIIKIAEFVAVVGGGGVFLFRQGRSSARIEASVHMQTAEISELKQDVKQINEVLRQLAIQKTRLDNIDRRLDAMDHRYDELRHGDGFVRGTRGIDKGYP